MTKITSVIVSGAGIGGLTFSLAALRIGLRVTIVERHNNFLKASAGGGLGLWPPSAASLRLLGGEEGLGKICGEMPSPSYRDKYGNLLARPSKDFPETFPVKVLKREDLQNLLFQLQKEGVEIISGSSVVNYARHKPNGDDDDATIIDVLLDDGRSLEGDMLVVADGINSTLRGSILEENGISPTSVKPQDCGYTYYRGVLEAPSSSPEWHSNSFESWGESSRFGFVPLRYPDLFWFASIPNELCYGLPGERTQPTSESEKEWLMNFLKDWKAPKDPVSGSPIFDILSLIGSTPPEGIIKTPIFKVPNVESFPWATLDGRVILLGDSAHATAPNLAQGAGLCIEDAVTLASLIQKNQGCINACSRTAIQYQEERKKRAAVVQAGADLVARVGQIGGKAALTRDWFMAIATKVFPRLEELIFERAVAVSLGGGMEKLSWRPPVIEGLGEQSEKAKTDRCHIGSLFKPEEWEKLPKAIREFRASDSVAIGQGHITVEAGDGMVSRGIHRLAGLPPQGVQVPFKGYVWPDNRNNSSSKRYWTRVFGADTPAHATVTTAQRCTLPFFSSNLCLSEGLKGIDWLLSFTYKITPTDTSVSYKSDGLLFGHLFHLPLPSFLLPTASWTETFTERGWLFKGDLTAPFFGTIMEYAGDFDITQSIPQPTGEKGRAIVLGGTGMIGRSICQQLVKEGFQVIILSRTPWAKPAPNGCIVLPYDGWENLLLIDDDTLPTTIVNVSGANPGSRRWTQKVKDDILNSRRDSISSISRALERTEGKRRNRVRYMQASASGIYGDRGSEELDEESILGDKRDQHFRASCCMTLEEDARKAIKDKTNVDLSILRIGFVLSAEKGSFLSYVEHSAFFCGSRIGPGTQFIPWIHLSDLSRIVSTLSSSPPSRPGSPVSIFNCSAPNPVPNSEFLSTLCSIRGKPSLFPVPALPLKFAIGESACVVLESQKMIPRKLIDQNFRFEYPLLRGALESEECTPP